MCWLSSRYQLESATRQTQALALHLAKASGAQTKQIASATEMAGEVASATEEVSGNAERAADVARHSVDDAHKGGDAVRRTDYDPVPIRDALMRSIVAVNAAQVAVTAFHQRLTADSGP